MANRAARAEREDRELTPHERAQLRSISFCDERTIVRWWAGEPIRQSSLGRLEQAAKQLGIRRPRQ
jgi:hypothetical protein